MESPYLVIHEERKLGPAYALCLLFGCLGAHRIYLRQPWGFLQAGLTVGGIATIFGVDLATTGTFLIPAWQYDAIAAGWCAVAFAVVWALVDVVRIPGWVRRSP